MSLQSSPLYSMLGDKMNWLTERQRVISRTSPIRIRPVTGLKKLPIWTFPSLCGLQIIPWLLSGLMVATFLHRKNVKTSGCPGRAALMRFHRPATR